MEQRDCLALHVAAHQRAVGVIMLQKRDESGRHTENLFGRNIHIFDSFRNFMRVSAADTRFNTFVHKLIFIIETGICLRNGEFLIHIGGHIFNFVGYIRNNLNIL